MKINRKLISIFIAAALVMMTSISAFAADQQAGRIEYHPPGYGTEYATPEDPAVFNTPVDKMTPSEEQKVGIIRPFTGIQSRAIYNQFAYITGSSDWTVYTTATGSTKKGVVSPRERVYVYNDNANPNRYYIEFVNVNVRDAGYVSTSAVRIPTSGWSRPITTGNISQDYGVNDHKGIDVAAPLGTSVYAVDNVSHSSKHMLGTINGTTRLVNFGNYISCVTSSREVIYAHLSSFTNGSVSSYPSFDEEYTGSSWSTTAATWTPNKSVKIGGVGSTGYSSGNHLHFEVRSSSNYTVKYDPLQYVVFPDIGY